MGPEGTLAFSQHAATRLQLASPTPLHTHIHPFPINSMVTLS